MEGKARAPRNRTIQMSEAERAALSERLLRLTRPVGVEEVAGRTVCQDALCAAPLLPERFVDLLVLDPPYNLTKTFQGREFRRLPLREYTRLLDDWLAALGPTLKPTASIYVCSEWSASAAVVEALERHFVVRNRITWEREKGRGAAANWKNCSEDIWFCTVSDAYTFNVDAVKLKRRVLAPYTDERGRPKDWTPSPHGGFRLTHPSNLWTDLTVPFWSMPENTDHPTQKPEKLVAKLVLASSNRGDVVLDPFLGSGTTSVVAKKLGRAFVGVEIEESYCCLAEKRLELADRDPRIQGYHDGVFWERNSHPRASATKGAAERAQAVFFEEL